MTTSAPPAAVVTDIDPWSDEVLQDPFPTFKKLRDLGPAAYLSKWDLWFVGRYDVVRAYLKDWQTFASGRGVGMNEIANEIFEGAVIAVDPPQHTATRKVFTDRLGPRQLKEVAETIDQRAHELVDSLLERGTFDAVTDLAQDLPTQIIMDLIGWPMEGRSELLSWADGSFNVTGPKNERMYSSLPRFEGLFKYVTEVATPANLIPGSFGASIYEAADRGEIPREHAVPLLLGYATAALDTTINSIGTGVWLFATHPEQWDAVRNDHSLINDAFNEILRYDPPVHYFSRVATRNVDMGEGVVIPEGARVAHSYAAANRDERHYPDPDRFDVFRRPSDHLAFDFGVHSCPGQSLAKLETHAVFRALAEKVTRIELNGETPRTLNNINRGFASIPVRVS